MLELKLNTFLSQSSLALVYGQLNQVGLLHLHAYNSYI